MSRGRVQNLVTFRRGRIVGRCSEESGGVKEQSFLLQERVGFWLVLAKFIGACKDRIRIRNYSVWEVASYFLFCKFNNCCTLVCSVGTLQYYLSTCQYYSYVLS